VQFETECLVWKAVVGTVHLQDKDIGCQSRWMIIMSKEWEGSTSGGPCCHSNWVCGKQVVVRGQFGGATAVDNVIIWHVLLLLVEAKRVVESMCVEIW